MILALTLMVRDEADIIAATLEHHLNQGVDRIIVTDNGSVDGTREILAEYAEVAPVTVIDDDRRDNHQAEAVTKMARQAATEFRASWVINGDGDEFLRPVDQSRTLHEVFSEMPLKLSAFSVPVINMVGRPARSGSGFWRLTLRDERSTEQLQCAGVHAHPTPNAIHVGTPDVEVAHGNHFVSIESNGSPPAGLELEVLHFPWRSWAQFERKTRNMGQKYELASHLRPSANHHGMRDFRRLRMGTLMPFYIRRLPIALQEGEGFVEDTSFRTSIRALRQSAVLPERLAAALDETQDEPFSDADIERLRAEAEEMTETDEKINAEHVRLLDDISELHRRTLELDAIVEIISARHTDAERRVSEVSALLELREAELAQAIALRGAEPLPVRWIDSTPVLAPARVMWRAGKRFLHEVKR